LALKSELEKAIAAADAELSRKEKSARTGGILLQSMVSDLQQELVSSREEISRLQLQKGELEMKIGDVSRDLDDYREKLKTALSDVKASVFDQARGGVFEQTKEEISKEVSRQIRLHMKGEKDDG
jgi:phage shock protein A